MTPLHVTTPADQSLARAAFERLRKAIVTHELAPGERVSERMLAARYELGRAAVRDALVRLETKRFVTAVSTRKSVVAPLTMEDVHTLFELRNLLEPHAAAQAAGNIDRQTFEELDRACMARYECGDADSEFAFLEANKAFHLAIAQAAGNPLQAEFIEQVQDACMRIMWVGLQLDNRQEIWRHGHEDIIDALVRGDREAAEKRALTHLLNGQRSIFETLATSPLFNTTQVSVARNT